MVRPDRAPLGHVGEQGRCSCARQSGPRRAGWPFWHTLIGGGRRGHWLVGLNGNIDAAISGPAAAPTTIELGIKAGYRRTPQFAIGMESYNGRGLLRRPDRLGQNEHATYATLDTAIGRWDLNLGVGMAPGTSGDDLIVKCIVGLPIRGTVPPPRATGAAGWVGR